MGRLKLGLLPVYALLGFVAVVALLPQSRWTLLTQWDVLAGRWRATNGYGNLEMGGKVYVKPVQRGLDEENPASDETARFLRLVTPSRDDPAKDAYYRRMAALHEICERKSKPEYWAQLVRAASFMGMILEPRWDQKRGKIPSRRETGEILLAACRAGARLDPENAFFPLIAASTLVSQGHREAGRRTYLAATRLAKYEDYVEFEPALRYRYLVENYGYRGRQLQGWLLMDTLLPHVTVIRSLARHFADSGDPEMRVAAVRLAEMLMRQDDSVIGLHVASSVLIHALGPHREPGLDDPPPSPEEVLRLAGELETAQSGDQGILRTARAHNALSPALRPIGSLAHDEDVALVVNLRPALSAWSMLALMLLPGAFAAAWLKARSPRFAAAAPYLVWPLAFPAVHAFGDFAAAAPPFGAASLLFVPALFPALRRGVDLVGIAVTVAAVCFSMSGYPLAIPALLFGVSLALERRAKGTPTALAVASIVLACALPSAYWVAIATRHSGPDAVAFGSMAVIGALAAVQARSPIRWAAVAGASSLLIGVWFGTMVYRDLMADKQLAVVGDEVLNEAERIRSETGAFRRIDGKSD